MDTQRLEKEVEWLETAEPLFKIKRKLKKLKEKERTLSKKLKTLSNGTTKLGRYEYTMSSRKGTVDYKTVPQLQGVDLEPYRKGDVEYWKLEIVE